MGIVALLAICVLLGSIAWSMTRTQDAVAVRPYAPSSATNLGSQSDASALVSTTAATSSTPLGDAIFTNFVSRYAALSQSGASQNDAENGAADIQPNVAHTTYTETDVQSTNDTSLARVLQYRADMRAALAPLLANMTPELEIYARYIDSGDSSYLAQLRNIAQNYHLAATSAAKVVVPTDAVHYQIGILNAMEEFSASLLALANNASDSIASIALLRTYNTAEQDMLNSFNSLALYSAGKTQ